MEQALPIKTQIEILQNIDFDRMYDYEDGLCSAIFMSMMDLKQSEDLTLGIFIAVSSQMFPLFTLENAKLYANADGHKSTGYWWSVLTVEALRNREKFVQWMIDTLNTQLENA